MIELDKKRRSGAIRFVLLRALGEAVVHPLPADRIRALLGAS